MKHITKSFIIFSTFLALLLASHPVYSANDYWDSQPGQADKTPSQIEKLIAALPEDAAHIDQIAGLTITEPYDGALFPPDIAAPTFRWKDNNKDSKRWLIIIEFQNSREALYGIAKRQSWTPPKEIWEIVKVNSITDAANVSVIGFNGRRKFSVTSQAGIRISSSTDRVGAPILYRQVLLPFKTGKEYIRKMKWRLGDISSYHKPTVVMEKLPICASCHSASQDGSLLSMEMNFRDDSGAQFITPVQEKISLSEEDFFTWNDFPRPGILPKTRGVFARMSPSGEYVVSTVNEISYMTLTNDPEFSQLFFPTHGILAWYSVREKTFHSLAGADDHKLIQTGPSWSPDEQYIVFSRAETRNEYHKDITNVRVEVEDADIYELNKKFPIQFDIYRIPFHHGKGGKAEPLEGASGNGQSNYFPRYSPDGKWIVFTQSPTGIMLQPGSKLYIVPAEGGEARKLNCNRGSYNSWHSWSPNGKWLLFTSKADSMYTDIFLTHIDEQGNDSPPVRLSRLSEKPYAANVPEFVNIKPDAIKKIKIKQ